MPSYKLYYFNARGRAELSRLIFAVAGQQYEDVRFEREAWPKYKEQSPFGHVPFLEVKDGDKSLTLPQSLAIARYLAHKFNLVGSNEFERAEVDAYADQITDLSNELVKIRRETDEAKKAEIAQQLAAEAIPNSLKLLEARAARSATGYLFSALTWVDLYLVVLLEWLGERKQPTLQHFPHLKAVDEKVRALPKIAEWISKRPVTDF